MHDFVVRESTYSPGLRQRRHAHDYSNITIVIAGKIEEAAERGEYCAHPGSVVTKGAGCEHEDRIGGRGARTISIQFHGDSPLPAGAWAWLDTPAVVGRAIAVWRANSASDRDRAVAELIAAVSAKRHVTKRPQWIDAITARIDRDHDQHVCFGELVTQLGLHPAYASRAFRTRLGLSMSEYLHAVRVRHARIALSSSRRSVAAIAAECGFADSSHLCRTFARALGVTPLSWRKLTS